MISVIKGDHTSLLWRTNSHHSHFVGGPLWQCRRASESRSLILWLLLLFWSQDHCPFGITLESPVIRAHASRTPHFRLLLQKWCLRVSPGRYLRGPRVLHPRAIPPAVSTFRREPDLEHGDVQGHWAPGGRLLPRPHRSGAVLVKSLLATFNFRLWNYWIG